MPHRSGRRRIDWRVLLIACATVTWGTGLGAQAAAPAGTLARALAGSQGGITGWTQTGSYDENTLSAGEGVATVVGPRHSTYELYRGIQSVPSNLQAQGWSHIGDPDSIRGYIFDAYQGPSSGTSKMFLVTTPSGDSSEYLHTLVPGELYNNSFVAVSPDTQWMVAGEWETMSHLQIYPTPLLNHTSPLHGGSLKLAGYIKLDHKVNDIQGCDFVTAVRLICASDDDSRTLFPNEKPLLQINLPRSLHGISVKGHVVDLGPIPRRAAVRAPSRQRESTSTHPPHLAGGSHSTGLLHSQNDHLRIQAGWHTRLRLRTRGLEQRIMKARQRRGATIRLLKTLTGREVLPNRTPSSRPCARDQYPR